MTIASDDYLTRPELLSAYIERQLVPYLREKGYRLRGGTIRGCFQLDLDLHNTPLIHIRPGSYGPCPAIVISCDLWDIRPSNFRFSQGRANLEGILRAVQRMEERYRQRAEDSLRRQAVEQQRDEKLAGNLVLLREICARRGEFAIRPIVGEQTPTEAIIHCGVLVTPSREVVGALSVQIGYLGRPLNVKPAVAEAFLDSLTALRASVLEEDENDR